ncbi:amidase [Nocardioides soli]|uniref:Aspartyl-tRNA(Asn)/glutamyl-tRNA(Gln) amidotransferase subunit A n=1 Tax=Nocardioides soli TaxID=1036020 RepID=A0A7W4VVV0_9ACTN|nr:amidase [Nocardioides soli]MBB3042697.1 aspartyl-tRNA(Asn)/glutamyl-tRNA(Gln) amidotransferase subunit A [Nocardioides soli]
MTDLDALTLVGAAHAIRTGERTSTELTEHFLARIEETEPAVHAWTTVDADGARAAARAADAAVAAGAPLGALHGVPLGVKDIVDTAGLRTTYGSPRWLDHVPDRDATAVARLRAAGAVVLGKHATHELAWGGRTDSARLGPTHNPHRRDHIPGGSSGGSAAAVAVGSCLGAIGTDTAGSVRIPAALSGCVGYKPGRGRVSLAGVMPLAPSLDHVGALARTVEDAAAIVAAIAGPDPADARTEALAPEDDPELDVRGLDVAFLTGWPTHPLDAGVAAAYAETRRRAVDAGLRVGDREVAGEAGAAEALLTRILAEAGARHRPTYAERPDLFGADLAELLALPAPTPRELAAAEATIARTSAQLFGLFADHDVLVLPTVAVPAPPIGATTVAVGGEHQPVEIALTRLTSPFNAAGLPVVSIPAGTVDGLPVGVQVVAGPGADRRALAVAAAIEAGALD